MPPTTVVYAANNINSAATIGYNLPVTFNFYPQYSGLLQTINLSIGIPQNSNDPSDPNTINITIYDTTTGGYTTVWHGNVNFGGAGRINTTAPYTFDLTAVTTDGNPPFQASQSQVGATNINTAPHVDSSHTYAIIVSYTSRNQSATAVLYTTNAPNGCTDSTKCPQYAGSSSTTSGQSVALVPGEPLQYPILTYTIQRDDTVDGGWSQWSQWSNCSATCGGGTQSQTRQCNNPPMENNGYDCVGPSIQSQSCNVDPCPQDGGWSPWAAWWPCNADCGGGIQLRNRTCTSPAPANGGAACVGSDTDTQQCNMQACTTPVDGGWSDWTASGSCTVSCGGGSQIMRRTCTNPVPQNGGQQCTGSSAMIQPCNTQACPPAVQTVTSVVAPITSTVSATVTPATVQPITIADVSTIVATPVIIPVSNAPTPATSVATSIEPSQSSTTGQSSTTQNSLTVLLFVIIIVFACLIAYKKINNTVPSSTVHV